MSITRTTSFLSASLVSIALLVATLVTAVAVKNSMRYPLPPGPRIERQPAMQPWKIYQKWSKEYGSSLLYLKPRGRDLIIINEVATAAELLEKRAWNYSSRPEFPMMDLIGRQDNVGFQRYGLRLKQCRKIIHESLNTRSMAKWHHIMDRETAVFLEELFNSPEGIEEVTHRFVASLIVYFTYGHEVDSDYIRLVEETSKHSSEAMIPGRWIVDSYPFLRYMPSWAPGGGFQIWAAQARTLFRTFTETPFNKVKQEIQEGIAPSSFVRDNLLEIDSDERSLEMESIIAATAASLYSAATDTTASILMTFFLMMVVHPEIQEKAFQEVMSVTGGERLPNLEDCKSFQYIEAILKEVHRFNPAVPMMPRSPEREDIYEECRIPKKSWIFINIWAMTHDEEQYKDPYNFEPERFMGDLNATIRDPREITFGFGRRRCPGIALANAAVILAMARVLAIFKISPIRDEQGNEVKPQVDFVTGFTSPPKHFKCIAKIRSSYYIDIIRQARSTV